MSVDSGPLQVVLVLWGRGRREDVRVAEVERSTAELLLERRSELVEPVVSEPKVPLEPNLQRKPTLVHRDTVSVQGVRLGMTMAEGRNTLGEPESLHGDFPERAWMIYSSHDSKIVDSTEIQFSNDRAVEILGTRLEHGKQSFRTTGEIQPLLDYFGKNDFQHAEGSGGSPVLCWSGTTVVLEVTTFGLDTGNTGLFYLGDPNFFHDRPHLWYTSCGAVIEPTPSME